MSAHFLKDGPLFKHISEWLSDRIIADVLKPHDKVPSTNELASFFKVNHITVARGVNVLVDKKAIYKRRGLGMFVSEDAKELLLDYRMERFNAEYIEPIADEATKLNIPEEQLCQMIKEARSKLHDSTNDE